MRGHKVGLSSQAMQQMMGVDEPDYGHLLDDMVVFEDERSTGAAICYPRVEVEVGFVLGAALPGAGCTVADVLRATEYVVPALELIDSRISDWRITLCDTIADNASSAGWCSAPSPGRARRTSTSAIDAVLTPQRRGGRRRQHRRRARQPGDRGRLAGQQGGTLRRAARGRAHDPARLVHPGHRRGPGDDFGADFAGLGSVSLDSTSASSSERRHP